MNGEQWLHVEASAPVARLLLAHGAGAPMDSGFMDALAEALAGEGIATSRFEFPYMAEYRHGGRKRPPDRQERLLECWRRHYLSALDRQRFAGETLPLLIGGKSLGGRMASLIADDLGASGLCCFGYPFHPPAKPDSLRIGHLMAIETPTLFVQGDRDPFGHRGELRNLELSTAIRIHWLDDGDHDFKPRKRSGRTQEQLIGEAARATRGFAVALQGSLRP
ncbi:MAG: alpha/beta family hydrolase [Porticoccaceae bacterium]|jgi:predicted alpha/beta-hydrolase family hydrolase